MNSLEPSIIHRSSGHWQEGDVLAAFPVWPCAVCRLDSIYSTSGCSSQDSGMMQPCKQGQSDTGLKVCSLSYLHLHAQRQQALLCNSAIADICRHLYSLLFRSGLA